MDQKINRDAILTSARLIRENYIFRMRNQICENTKRHVQRGFLQRLSMIAAVAVILDDELNKATGPIGIHLAERLSLFVNSYYLNLAGSLDNLAWALTYHHSLLANIDENEIEHRKVAQLLNRKFLTLLSNNGLAQLSDTLIPFTDWYWEMREFRDPAAHRIPLFVPQSIYSEADVAKANELDKEGSDLIASGEYDEGMCLIRESFSLGEFVPIFTSESPRIKNYFIAERINYDNDNWTRIVMAVFDYGFPPKTTNVS